MGSYRDDDKRLASLDRHTLGWHAARYGIGMLAVSLGNFVIGGSLIFSAIIGAIGLPVFVYGMRNP